MSTAASRPAPGSGAPSRLTHLVAHRGDVQDWPENTLPGFRSALGHGARFLLIDVQLAADTTPVVIREAQLAATAGVDGFVFDHPGDQLAALDVSEPGRFGDRHRGTALPRLADVVDLLAEHPELTVFCELKSESLARYGSEVATSRILDVIRSVRGQCIFVSSDVHVTHLARSRSGCQVGWLLNAYDEHARLKYEAVKPEFVLCERRLLPNDGRRFWRGPWSWVILGVDDVEAAAELAERGADFIATSSVGPMAEALRARTKPL